MSDKEVGNVGPVQKTKKNLFDGVPFTSAEVNTCIRVLDKLCYPEGSSDKNSKLRNAANKIRWALSSLYIEKRRNEGSPVRCISCGRPEEHPDLPGGRLFVCCGGTLAVHVSCAQMYVAIQALEEIKEPGKPGEGTKKRKKKGVV